MPPKKTTGKKPSTPKKQKEEIKVGATMKMLQDNPSFSKLPLDAQSLIEKYIKRGVGRPRATPEQRAATKEKQRESGKLRKRAERLLMKGQTKQYMKVIDDAFKTGVITHKTVDTLMRRLGDLQEKGLVPEAGEENPYIEPEGFGKQGVKLPQIVQMPEFALEMSGAADAVYPLKEPREVPLTQEEKTKLNKELEDYLKSLEEKEIILTQGTDKKPKATSSGISDLKRHFINYDKSDSDKPENKMDFFTVYTPDFKNKLQDSLERHGVDADIDKIKYVFDNFLSKDEQEVMVETGNYDLLTNVIKKADTTSKYVPNFLEGNEDKTQEERQKLYHQDLIRAESSIERTKKQPTNFDNNTAMCGGIMAGTQTKTEQQEAKYDYETPEMFNDYEFLLDNKISDNAIMNELYKGVNPNQVIDVSADPEELANYFAEMNEKSNEQDVEEVKEAVDNIEILSGGNRDTLFGATDLLSTRNPNLNMRFNQDMPYEADDAPPPIERGQDAQPLNDVELAQLEHERRVEGVTTIAHAFGILNSAYRSIYGMNDVVNDRNQNDILGSINQNMRLAGRRGIYGNADELKQDDDMYEGMNMNQRLNNLRDYNNQRIYGRQNPNMLKEPEPAQDQNQELMNAMMFNKQQGGAQGATLQQLRQQTFAYKQANRKVAHDGYAFIRGGKATAIKLEQEFDV